jgi:ribose 5-phosphate isomerase B
MKVYIASDHGGFALKENIKNYLSDNGYEVEDFGAFSLDSEDDYPDFVIPLAVKVAKMGSLGIVLGKSGNGEAIAANKVQGIRAALCLNTKMTQLAREHNDANILSLGASFVDFGLALEIVKVFLQTQFSGDIRHVRRISKIKKYESAR